MVFTTPYLRRAPRRVALSTQAFALPGTYQLSKVIGAAVGALIFAIPGFILLGIFGAWWSIVAFSSVGGIVGVAISSWKSSTGEGLAQWALLFAAKRTGLVKIGGRWVRAYVGACRLSRPMFGPVQVVAASTEALTAAEFHGQFITSTPVRPKSRRAAPEDVNPNEPSPTARRAQRTPRGPASSTGSLDSLLRSGACAPKLTAARHARSAQNRGRRNP